MLKRFIERMGYVSKAEAVEALKAKEKYPDWYLEYAGANVWNVPAPEMYAEQADLMTKVSYLYTVITLTAQSAASQDFDIEQGEREIENHPLERLLKSPNPMQTGFEFLRDHFTYKLLNGGSYWWLNCTAPDQIPTEIWIIPPGNIEPVPDDKLGILHYLYHPGDGQEIIIPTWQIIWFRGFHPSNQYASLSGLTPLKLAMKTDIDTQRYLSTVYGSNSGRLPGIIAFKSPVNDIDWRKIKEDVRKSSNERNYMMLRGVGDGVSWLQAAATINEMQTLQGRNMTKEDIYNVFAPGLMNMTAVNATEANAVTGKKTFAEFTLYPLLVDTEQKINKELSPRFGDIELEFDDPRPDDKTLEMAVTAQFGQYHTVNEVRVERFKTDPLPPDDPRGMLFVSQVNAQTPTEEEPEPEPMPEAAPIMPEVVEPEQEAEPVEDMPEEEIPGITEIMAELKAWRKFVSKPRNREFIAHHIPAHTVAAIKSALLSGIDPKVVFDMAEDGVITQPRIDTEAAAVLEGLRMTVEALKAQKAEQPAQPMTINLTANMPQPGEPTITVNVPQQAAPVVNVASVQPVVNVMAAEQPAPVVNVNAIPGEMTVVMPAPTPADIIRDAKGNITEIRPR